MDWTKCGTTNKLSGGLKCLFPLQFDTEKCDQLLDHELIYNSSDNEVITKKYFELLIQRMLLFENKLDHFRYYIIGLKVNLVCNKLQLEQMIKPL